MQVTIARQLGLDPSTVSNFFMNARRRSVDKWKDDRAEAGDMDDNMNDSESEDEDNDNSASSPPPMSQHNIRSSHSSHYGGQEMSIKNATVLVTSGHAHPAAVVQHLQGHGEAMTPTAALDL